MVRAALEAVLRFALGLWPGAFAVPCRTGAVRDYSSVPTTSYRPQQRALQQCKEKQKFVCEIYVPFCPPKDRQL
jgi:hypothetical protein